MNTEPLVLVGIDWASTEHQVRMIGRGEPMQRAFTHDAGGIGAMVDWVCCEAEHVGQIAVAIEVPHGPVVEALMDRGVAVFAINPKQLDRFRDRFSGSDLNATQHPHLLLGNLHRRRRGLLV